MDPGISGAPSVDRKVILAFVVLLVIVALAFIIMPSEELSVVPR